MVARVPSLRLFREVPVHLFPQLLKLRFGLAPRVVVEFPILLEEAVDFSVEVCSVGSCEHRFVAVSSAPPSPQRRLLEPLELSPGLAQPVVVEGGVFSKKEFVHFGPSFLEHGFAKLVVGLAIFCAGPGPSAYGAEAGEFQFIGVFEDPRELGELSEVGIHCWR